MLLVVFVPSEEKNLDESVWRTKVEHDLWGKVLWGTRMEWAVIAMVKLLSHMLCEAFLSSYVNLKNASFAFI